MQYEQVIKKIREWVSGFIDDPTPGAKLILKRYKSFLNDFPTFVKVVGWDHCSEIKYIDFLKAVGHWQKNHPI